MPDTNHAPITKSQFKLGLDCIQKLRHARNGLPQATQENGMLRLLAEGGGAIEALWRQKEPGWVGPVGHAPAALASLDAIRSAVELSRQRGQPVPLYEVTIMHGGFLARIDLLRVSESTFEVVELKAISVVDSDSANEENKFLGSESKGDVSTRTILSERIPYLQDLAFQTVLLRQWLMNHCLAVGVGPAIKVMPGMILVNKGGRSSSGDSLGSFKTTHIPSHRGPRAQVSYVGQGFANTDLLVEMKGIPELIGRIEGDALSNDAAFKGLGIAGCMEQMAKIVQSGQWPDASKRLGPACKKCEFRTCAAGQSGFDECWGAGRATLHILTLPRVNPKQVEATLALATRETASAGDVPEAMLTASQRAAWESLQTDPPAPIVAAAFRDPNHRHHVMRRGDSSSPCYFLDFECAMYPIPQRVGGRPYEKVPFQFEAHRLPSFDADLGRRERLEGFLDLTSADPRVGFLRALRRQMGDSGVIYHWHSYERDVLRDLKSGLRCSDAGVPADAPALIEFIDSLIGEGSHAGSGRLCDLLKIAEDAFYHPAMLGSYSIKKVLPVAWAESAIRAHFCPGHGCAGDPDSYADAGDPYKSLPPLSSSFIDSLGGMHRLRDLEHAAEASSPWLPVALKDGGMAMLFYHYVRMFGGADRQEIREQFRNYCGLDSAAMLMVFRYMTDFVPKFKPSTTAF
jgi:hypothetical protein